MLFNSYSFLLAFLPVFLVAFYVARKESYRNPGSGDVCKWLVVLASLIFYAPFGVKNLVVLGVSIAVNAVLSSLIASKRSKSLLAIAVVLNVVSLLFFKFSGFFFPVAVSFYTFNQISYVVDTYRGETGKFSIVDYLAYILFFPKLLQGPLMGYKDFEKSMDDALDSREDFEVILRALFLLSLGLFKKVILADTFGKAVDFGYENLTTLGSLEAVLIAVFYSFQLYFDFSGYCDMAAAVCMAIGFELPVNFNSPYKAVGIVDFWKRWHISLTKFFTKYVYIPLGGNRRGAARTYLNLMIVFLLSGLWHGNGWTFIVWGAMHGVLYVAERALGSGKNKAAGKSVGDTKKEPVVVRAVKELLTFAYVTIAWVFFRADTIRDALTLIIRMFTGGHKRLATHLSSCFQLDEIWYVIKVTPISKLSFGWDICLWLFLIVAVVIIFFCENAITTSRKCRIGAGTTVATLILMLWSIISLAGVSTFLYMNF